MKSETSPAMDSENETDMPVLGPLSGYAGYQIRQAQVAVFRDIAGRLGRFGVTPGEFSLLTLIRHNEGIEPGQLARHYDLDKSTLSYAIARLDERGLIERRRTPHDKRRQALRLTGAGDTALNQAIGVINAQEKVMAGALGQADLNKFLEMLEKVTRALNARGD